ncbi:MAG: glycosyltransferase [Anaerolineae bacterium]|nr:glycosyltransferase [Anaerolineae bacterium]
MKIAVITPSRVPATTANSIQVMKATHALAQAGHQARLWVPGTTGVPWQRLVEQYGLADTFEISWLASRPRLRRYDFMWGGFRQARRWGADLIYTWMVPVAWMAASAGLPSIIEMHGPLSGRLAPGFFRRYLKTPSNKRALVITQALQEMLATAFPNLGLTAITQISPNGFDMEAYRDLPEPSEARAHLNLPQGMTVAYTGHFYPGRGMDILLALAKHFPQINFLWVGGHAEAIETWRARLEREGINNITLTGFVPMATLPIYQAAAEVLVMPYERVISGSSGGDSAAYCSPMKMFDYLASGRAILSSDLPVIHEVLNEGNAVFCPPEDAGAWVDALGSLMQHPERITRLSAQAKTDASDYTWLARAQKALAGFS